MPFAPGNKLGNRNGRPRVRDSLADAVRHKWPPDKILDLAEQLLTDEKSDTDMKYRVMTFLADRGYGKAPQTIDINAGELTPEEYAEELAVIAREHIESLPPEERIKLMSNTAPSNTVQ